MFTPVQPDQLVPDPVVARELGVSLPSIYRWDHDERKIALGWPPPVRPSGNQVYGRKYRSRHAIEQFKFNVMATALNLRTRAAETAAPSPEAA